MEISCYNALIFSTLYLAFVLYLKKRAKLKKKKIKNKKKVQFKENRIHLIENISNYDLWWSNEDYNNFYYNFISYHKNLKNNPYTNVNDQDDDIFNH